MQLSPRVRESRSFTGNWLCCTCCGVELLIAPPEITKRSILPGDLFLFVFVFTLGFVFASMFAFVRVCV